MGPNQTYKNIKEVRALPYSLQNSLQQSRKIWKLPKYPSVTEWIKKKKKTGSSHCGSAETNMTSIHDYAHWVKDPVLP